MLGFDEALNKILSVIEPLPAKRLTLDALLGSVLAEPVIANFDLPAFDNSAVDGFGVRLIDTQSASAGSPVQLPLQGKIQAGDSGNTSLAAGKTLKILTGAPVPPGVDAVIMKEYTEESNGTVQIKQAPRSGMNIRRTGEEYKNGQKILESGVMADPAVIGLLATLGYSSFSVHKKPSVAIISTGNELVRPGDSLKPGQIYDSNSYALTAAVMSLGITAVTKLHAKDDPESTRVALTKALNSSDIVISAGGVSVGDYDFIKDVAEQIGIETVLWKIAIKPGKPVYFGIYTHNNSRKLIFGLPGNPVSALVTFHQLVKPAIWKLAGRKNVEQQKLVAILQRDLKKQAGRMEFVRGVLSRKDDQLFVMPVKGQDSHMMSGIAQANCLIYFPAEAELLLADHPVMVEQLNWCN